tara:strand:+ start:703 stop:1290 length:588 start_codon:yes stop_codon:yes gene_type:complete
MRNVIISLSAVAAALYGIHYIVSSDDKDKNKNNSNNIFNPFKKDVYTIGKDTSLVFRTVEGDFNEEIQNYIDKYKNNKDNNKYSIDAQQLKNKFNNYEFELKGDVIKITKKSFSIFNKNKQADSNYYEFDIISSKLPNSLITFIKNNRSTGNVEDYKINKDKLNTYIKKNFNINNYQIDTVTDDNNKKKLYNRKD